MLNKHIFVHGAVAIETHKLQRIALFYDQVLLWTPLMGSFLEKEDTEKTNGEIAYLREMNIVKTAGWQMTAGFDIGFTQEDGTVKTAGDVMAERIDLPIPIWQMTKLSKLDSEDPKAQDYFSYQQLGNIITFDEQPLVLYQPGCELCEYQTKNNNVLEFTMNNIAMPPDNLPWEDLIAFRDDDDNKMLLRNFRLWLHDAATKNEDKHIQIERLLSLKDDYEQEMRRLSRDITMGTICTILKAAPELIGTWQMMGLNALKGAVSVKNASLANDRAKHFAPGREVAFIVELENQIYKPQGVETALTQA